MADAPTLERVMDCTRHLIDAGAALHWLFPFDYVDDKGQQRGKTPRAPKWSQEPVFDAEDLRASYKSRSNIGIRLGEPSKIGQFYIYVVDLDIRKPEKADEAWAVLLKLWPEAREFPTVMSGSGGESRHIYFVSDKPFSKRKLAKSDTFTMVWNDQMKRHVAKNDWEIDLMGTGSQAVLPPSIHPDSREPYKWLKPLDLDLVEFGTGPIVSSALVESWGVREVVSSDDDDLETLWANSPLDLDEDEIDAILAAIPNDTPEMVDGKIARTGAHYDDYIEVGMALHHQYQGDEHGFQKWVEWASQSSKFDIKHARYRWDKSFGGAKNPVRMATLIQKANAYKMAEEHDFEIEDDWNLIDQKPTTVVVNDDDWNQIDLPAGNDADGSWNLIDLPADAKSVAVEMSKVEVISPDAVEIVVDWKSLLHRNEEGEIKSTSHNVSLIVEHDTRLAGVIGFNNFTQEIVIRKRPPQVKKKRGTSKPPVNLNGPIWENIDPINGDMLTDSHVASIRRMLEAPTTQGGYGIKVSDRDLELAFNLAAHKNAFHPIKDKIEPVIWDGQFRAATLWVDYLGVEDNPYHRESAIKLLVAAIARLYEPGHKFDQMAIIEGPQGLRKSTFIETLAFGYFAELEGDLSDRKAMVEKMQGAWILEMPELQGITNAEVNIIKGFLSARKDKVRLAYARRAFDFKRQCIFMGSTNEKEYLRDPTGGRRFWPIHCNVKEIDIERLRRNLPQIWAEALMIYKVYRQKKPNLESLPLYLKHPYSIEKANSLQESRTQESPEQSLAGQIQAWLDTPINDDSGFDDLDLDAPKVYRNETCIAQIWNEMLGRQGAMNQAEATKIGRAMKLIGWQRSAGPMTGYEINKRYGKTRVYLRPKED